MRGLLCPSILFWDLRSSTYVLTSKSFFSGIMAGYPINSWWTYFYKVASCTNKSPSYTATIVYICVFSSVMVLNASVIHDTNISLPFPSIHNNNQNSPTTKTCVKVSICTFSIPQGWTPMRRIGCHTQTMRLPGGKPLVGHTTQDEKSLNANYNSAT